MLGLPGETPADVDECVRLLRELSRSLRVTLTVSPFCAKAGTPLAGAPFAGLAVIEERIRRLRCGLQGRLEVRATSPKWAWIEHVLAQGNQAEGRAVAQAVLVGGRFADFRAVFRELGHALKGELARAFDHRRRRSRRRATCILLGYSVGSRPRNALQTATT